MGIKWSKHVFASTGRGMGRKKRTRREGSCCAGVRAGLSPFDSLRVRMQIYGSLPQAASSQCSSSHFHVQTLPSPTAETHSALTKEQTDYGAVRRQAGALCLRYEQALEAAHAAAWAVLLA